MNSELNRLGAYFTSMKPNLFAIIPKEGVYVSQIYCGLSVMLENTLSELSNSPTCLRIFTEKNVTLSLHGDRAARDIHFVDIKVGTSGNPTGQLH